MRPPRPYPRWRRARSSLMWSSVRERPAGTPSMTAVRASPCDSPDVRKRNATTPSSYLSHRGPRNHRLEHGRRHEDDQLTPLRGIGLRLEQPAQDGHVSHVRHFANRVLVGGGCHTTDDEALSLI